MSRAIASVIAPSPANDSLAEMQNEVARFVLFPDVDEVLDIAGQEIRNGIKYVNTRVWQWNITWLDITTVLDQADYKMADDLKVSFMLQRLDSNGDSRGQPLRYMDYKTFVFRYPNSDKSGSPTAYSVVNNIDTTMLSLSVPCGQSFVDSYPTLRHYYYRRLAELSLPNQRLIAPPEVELFIKWYAKEKVAAVFSPQLVAIARGERFSIWNALINDDLQTDVHDWRS